MNTRSEEIYDEVTRQSEQTRSKLAATLQQELLNQTIIPLDIKDDEALVNLYTLSLKLADAVIEIAHP